MHCTVIHCTVIHYTVIHYRNTLFVSNTLPFYQFLYRFLLHDILEFVFFRMDIIIVMKGVNLAIVS